MLYLSRRNAIISTISVLAFPHLAHARNGGRYIGTVSTTWLSNRMMRLDHDFGYVDPRGRTWPVSAPIEIDGASIPQAAWSFIGGPFTGLYREASVIHDHYCDTRMRSQHDTHRVFYDGMITSGVEPWRAGLMYAAVLVGGPKWSTVRVRSASLQEVQNVFGAEDHQVDWAARLAASSAIDAIGVSRGQIGASRDETFSALAESLPEAPNDDLAWQFSGESPTTTITLGNGEVGAQVLGSQQGDLLIGLEETLPFTDDDFQALAERLGQVERSTDEVEAIADDQATEIRARSPL